jgi:hypothetical protein
MEFKDVKELFNFDFGVLNGDKINYLVNYLIDDEVELLTLYMNKIGFPTRSTYAGDGIYFYGPNVNSVKFLYKKNPSDFFETSRSKNEIPIIEKIVLTKISKIVLYDLITTLIESGKFTKGKSYPSVSADLGSGAKGISRQFKLSSKIRNHNFSIVTFDYDGKESFNEIQFVFN